MLLTGGTETASDEELERALGRLLAEHVRPGSGTVDPAVMQELVATLSRLGLRLPGDVVLLSRALVTVDGTMRALVADDDVDGLHARADGAVEGQRGHRSPGAGA